MNLRNIHNESYVAVYDEGDVKMQGLDGSTNIFIKKVNNNIWHKSDIGGLKCESKINNRPV